MVYTNSMQDMNPRGDRSIRNIPISANHHRRAPVKTEDHGDTLSPRPPRRRRGRHWWQWVLAVVLVSVAGGLLLSTVFQGAQITIYPKTEAIAAPITIEAESNAPSGKLSFQRMTLNASATTTVKASGTQHVSKSASGIITIRNSFSSANQQLIANTRFETSDGKIYRVRVPIVVPGQQKQPDGTFKPGTVSVTVYADKPGEAYNLPAGTTFTIPGFKGDTRYSKFTATAEGPLSGGFVGEQPGVSTADMTAAQNALKQQLEATLTNGASANLPEGFFLINEVRALVYTDITQSPAGSDSSNLSQTAQASFAIVRASELAAAIAKQKVDGYAGEPVGFLDPSQITLALVNDPNREKGAPISFTVNGTPTLVWEIDAETLKGALVGKDKSAFQTIIENFGPSISKAEASIRPFWKTVFPSDESKITVVIKK